MVGSMAASKDDARTDADDDDRDDDDDSGGWPKGLVAVGGRLDADTLTRAYRAGIFPWSSDPEITWWSPDPRAIFDLDEFRAVAQPAQEHPARGLDRSPSIATSRG